MTSEKPLHVRVAEALGWTDMAPEWISGQSSEHPDWRSRILRYDTDWSATGPLIEKYKIDLRYEHRLMGLSHVWIAEAPFAEDYETGMPRAQDPSLLIAVCNLILALKAAGKL